jgi:lysophospholipase L1-like esterase
MISAMSRVLRQRSGRLRRETGAATLEYVGMTLLVAGFVVGMLLTGMGARVADRLSASVCQILQVENCPTFGTAASGDPSVATKTPLEHATQGTYVAMGDSYSSGEGAKQYIKGSNFDDRNDLWPFNDDQEAHNRCRRSENAYSQVITNRFDFTGGSTFVACSGATVSDLTDPNSSNTGEQPQLDALNKDTSLATISIGGNDLGFAEIVQACIVNGAGGLPGVSKCQDKYEPQMSGRLADLKKKLSVQYQAMKDKAPNARIIIMGYPHLFVDNPGDSFGNLLFKEDQIWMNEKGTQLNAMLKATAEEAGVEFVDPSFAFKGHELGSKDPWINDLDFGGPGIMLVDPGSFHPNAQGQSVMAGLMGDQIEKPK